MEPNKKKYLVLDLGTTNVKAFIFDGNLKIIAKEQKEITKNITKKVWIEQSPGEMVSKSIEVIRKVFKNSGIAKNQLVSFGITTQRETSILWNAKTGKAVYPAIVWEDGRTEKYCQSLKHNRKLVESKTGLPVNPYFSASKIHWMLENVPTARQLLAKGLLKFGTPDAWILWNLTKNHEHVTDYTNACRTLLFNIHSLKWDKELLKIFGVSAKILPSPKPSKYNFGKLRKDILGFELPIMAVCGDQQASLFAAGSNIGDTKITYGTGTFVMQIANDRAKIKQGFFTTLAATAGKKVYAVEAKLNIGAKQVKPLLKKPKELRNLILKIAKGAAKIVSKLPLKPKRIIIDGGITQYKNLDVIQSKLCNISVKKQNPYDGTALGVAKLLNL